MNKRCIPFQLILPENERSRDVAVISLPEDVINIGTEGGVIGWNQVKIHD